MISYNESKKIPNQEDIEKIKQEALIELLKTNQEIRKERKKRIFKISIVVVLVTAVMKIFFGTIELYNILGYPPSKVRYYKLTVNGEQIETSQNVRHKIPIIPFLINFNSYCLGNSDIVGDERGHNFIADGSEKYIIDISSYSCYFHKTQVECKNNEQEMKKNKDTRYTKMIITRTSNPYKILYSGNYVNDISPYVKKKGIYHVEITANHFLNEDKVYFYFRQP